jgi:hypothetical protein
VDKGKNINKHKNFQNKEHFIASTAITDMIKEKSLL